MPDNVVTQIVLRVQFTGPLTNPEYAGEKLAEDVADWLINTPPHPWGMGRSMVKSVSVDGFGLT